MQFLVAVGIVVAANLVALVADLLGGDGDWWKAMAYALAVGILCAVIW